MYRITYCKSDMHKAAAAIQVLQSSLGTTGTRVYADVRRVFDDVAERYELFFQEKGVKDEPAVREMVFSLDDKGRNGDTIAIVNTSPVHMVYYTPFPCMFAQVEGLYQAKAGYAVTRHMGDATKPLAKFGPHAMFYIVCHGDKTGGEATCDCGNCGNNLNLGRGLTPGELWQRLKADGLPHNPSCIRLWACLGADPPANDPTGKSFAAYFHMQASWDDEFKTERTLFQSFSGYLTMTKNGGYSYTQRENEATKVRAMDRLRTIAKPQQVK